MKQIITDQRERVGAWVARQIHGGSKWDGTFSAMGLEQDGELVAGVVIDEWVPGNRCSLHCAGIGRNWLNKQFLFCVFDYIFNQLGCKVIINTVVEGNADSLRFTKHIGFSEVCRIPNADETGGLVIFTYYRDQCRWLDLAVR